MCTNNVYKQHSSMSLCLGSYMDFYACTSKSIMMKYVDEKLDAMDKGVMNVCAQGVWPNGLKLYLWEWTTLESYQWKRLCALLQRYRIPSRLLWREVHYMSNAWFYPTCFEIDYVWQDLDAIQVFLQNKKDAFTAVRLEVDRRAWMNGLRRTWLAAVMM
jgi:hypothetical protein